MPRRMRMSPLSIDARRRLEDRLAALQTSTAEMPQDEGEPREVAVASERILLVDDEVNARSALRSLLGDDGYQVREAKDGEEGLRQLADFAPAVVLCDVRMPGMDGLQLLKKAKEQGSDAIFLM